MKTPVKAALWSALVFPGLGQMSLKRYVRGLIFMVLVLAGLGILIAQATTNALDVLEKIKIQGGAVDMNILSNLAAESAARSHSSSHLLWIGIALCWILSVIDAYRLGKEKDRAGMAG